MRDRGSGGRDGGGHDYRPDAATQAQVVLDLHFRSYGEPGARPLLLLHGLLGSSANWHSIARRLETRFRVLVPDLRNHGRSPHSSEMDYPLMAGDVRALMDRLGLEAVTLVGHSMGGKVAMRLALETPERVSRLVPVDMAPARYSNTFSSIFGALHGLDLTSLQNRAEADRRLTGAIEMPGLRQFLLQNLQSDQGRWRWRVNLEGVTGALPALQEFPVPPGGRQFTGPTLFVYGGASDYLLPEHAPQIRKFFPLARLRMVPGAGHWVYAEQPEGFLQAISAFLAD